MRAHDQAGYADNRQHKLQQIPDKPYTRRSLPAMRGDSVPKCLCQRKSSDDPDHKSDNLISCVEPENAVLPGIAS